MSDALKDPTLNPDEDHILDPSISEEKLEFLYGQMANILLQLSTLTFPQIWSLVQDVDGAFSVSGRPLTQNMSSLVELTNAPATLLPSQQYSSAVDWYSALADMHLMQLTFQLHDAVEDEDDARDKYVAHQLFRRLASKGELCFGSGDISDVTPSFRLFSEDLRPSNVLVDKDLRVVGVVDWEFAYVAPAQFSFDPPWWLLLKCPENWPGGYYPWMEAYKPRLETFLRVLESEEGKMRSCSGIASSRSSNLETPLSQRMRESWEKQNWMINYAARN